MGNNKPLFVAIVAFVMSMLLMIASMFRTSAQSGDISVRIAHLDNGMKVMLCEDHTTAKIYGGVCVHAGSKNDPADATGMAHYLEHMMFKGTDRIGTLSWEAEKPLIDSLAKLYDELSASDNDKEKAAILKQINKVSAEAAQYAIPNEVDAILGKMGGSNVNAFTTNDITTYFNIFPSNQLEKWSKVYAERFRHPVFRLFQSELESVYEEYNMYSDDPFSVFQEDVYKAAFGNHPYGVPIIGYPEHIKNPSMSKMYSFFYTYYVPSNMTLILVGNFNADAALKVLNKTWCHPDAGKKNLSAELDLSEEVVNFNPQTKTASIAMAKKQGNNTQSQYKQLPKKQMPAIQKFEGKQIINTQQTPIKTGEIIFQTEAERNENTIVLELCASILSNSSSTGIMDKMLNDGELYSCNCYNSPMVDAGIFEIRYTPKLEGQSHEQAEALIFSCLDKLKKGEFSDELFNAVKMTYLRYAVRDLEDIYSKFFIVLSLDMLNQTGDTYNLMLKRVSQLTKEQLVAVANQYFTDNCMIYRSDVGTKKTESINKPSWKPITSKNTDKKSEFFTEVEHSAVSDFRKQKIDFEKDLSILPINNAFDLYYAKNPCNDIFTMEIVFNYGIINNEDLENAVAYFNQQGTQNMSLEEFNLTLQAMGAEIDMSTSDTKTWLSISGFEKDFNKIIALCQEKLYNTGNDEKKINLLIEDHANMLAIMKESAESWSSALASYAIYGSNSRYLKDPTLAQMKKYNGQMLLDMVLKATQKDGYVTFVGNINTKIVKSAVKDNFQLFNVARSKNLELIEITSLKDSEKQKSKDLVRPIVNYHSPEVLVLHNSKFIQSNIWFYIPDNKLDENERMKAKLFNEYYDGGMNGVVFQNIRELRSLGYSASGYMSYDELNRRKAFTIGYLGTQSDKTIDGIKAMSNLLKNMEQKQEKFDLAKESLILQMESSYIHFRDIPSEVQSWKKQGYESDPRSSQISLIANFTMSDINYFFNNNIGKKPMIITVAGNMNRINKKQLAKFGKVTFMKYSDVVKE